MLNDLYHMLDPVAIAAGPITIYWYGPAYVVGALLTAVVMYRTQRRWGFNITIDDLTSVVVGVVFGLIIGARLFYVVFTATATTGRIRSRSLPPTRAA